MLSFNLPWIWLLLPLPLLAMRLPPAQQNSAALYTPFFDRLPNEQQSNSALARRAPLLTLSLIWVLLLSAAAQPVWIGDAVQLPASGRNLMLAVDISGSMQVEDMQHNGQQVSRLYTVKNVVNDFVEERRGDKLGLILFGSRAYLQTPLTFDRHSLQQQLQEARIGFAGEKTAIGDAIGLAIKRLEANDDASRVLILLTDGANTEGEVQPRQAAKLAEQTKVKIYTIGLGADQMMTPGLLGSTFGARMTNPSADLDEETLQYIADTTGGRYFRARDPEELKNIYQQLDALEAIEQEDETFRPQKAYFYWPLGVAMVLVFLWFLVRLAARLSARVGE
jgi:Ca-activated chloride channel family protein